MREMHLNMEVFFVCVFSYMNLTQNYMGYTACISRLYISRSNIFMDFNMYKHVVQISVQQVE